MHLDQGALFSQEASEYDEWTERTRVLKDQSPSLTNVDQYGVTQGPILLADRRAKRVFAVKPDALDGADKPFRKIELGGSMSAGNHPEGGACVEIVLPEARCCRRREPNASTSLWTMPACAGGRSG